MAQICEERKSEVGIRYILPLRSHEARERIDFSPKPAFEPIGVYDIFEPIRGEVCSKKVRAHIPFRDFKRIIEIEKQVLDESLEESSLKLCSKLRVAVGLSDQFEADETALTNLDGFLADLAGERVDASELLKAARRRL